MKYVVDGVHVTCSEDESIVSGSVNVYTTEFTFDDSWDEYIKIAVFKRGGEKRSQVLEDGKCTIPWEVLESDLIGDLRVGVRGVTESKNRPTLWATPKVVYPGATHSDKSKEPTPNIQQQLIRMLKVDVEEIEGGHRVTFNDTEGEKTFDVMDGEDGDTPQKGVDYYTEADKAEMVEAVLDELPDEGDLQNEINLLKSEALRPCGFLYEVTEGLTDADTFPYNTIYTLNNGSRVENLPATPRTGTLITFGSTNTNNGATQLFIHYTNVMWFRRKTNGTYGEWIRFVDDNRVLSHINSNNNTVLAMKYGALLTSEQEAPLNDADTFPTSTIYTIAVSANTIDHLPSNAGTLMTYNHSQSTNAGKCQLFVTQYGYVYSRIYFNSAWTAWKMLATESNVNSVKTECKAYTDALKSGYVDEYVSLSMFEKFGIIGDSYSSGAIYVLNEDGTQKSAGTYYNLSWGQIMARKLGTTCTNFSKGGLSTRTWLTDDKGLSLLLSTEPQNIYYLMLGINDKTKHGVEYIGTISDIKADYAQNADTFYGNYGKIIGNIMTYAPNAKIIMSTMTGTTGTNKQFNDAIEAIAAHFDIPCVKQYENDFFNSNFYKNNIVVSHPTAPVYSGMANALQKMFEDAIRDNVTYFNDYIG